MGGPSDFGSSQSQGRHRSALLEVAMRYRLLRQGMGVQVVYRSAGGGLVVGGLSYAALFAIIPTLVLVVAGIYWLVDDPNVRADAVELISDAFPAFADITTAAVDGARDVAAVGGVIAIAGFVWGASGLYLNLTRAMERFFPGERVGGVLARVLGVLLVALVIVAVLAAVLMAGVVTVVVQALQLDSEWALGLLSGAVTLLVASGLVYGVYRQLPANPPAASSARLPAALVGVVIGAMTLLYSFISPWLVSGYQAYGVVASTFVALLWLRLTFLAIVYGAALSRYRDYAAEAAARGRRQPTRAATRYALAEERRRETDGSGLHV
jgi:uncharacterized BrkB/YihY/UPF0761 family membrane protein